jgi:hypothetical protein
MLKVHRTPPPNQKSWLRQCDKLPDLQHLLHSYKYDVLCITETWLHAAAANSIILAGSSYSVFRADRSASCCGGGVCILTNNCTTKVVRVFLPPAYSHLELCVVDLLSRYNKLRLFVCYRPAKRQLIQACSPLRTRLMRLHQ